VDGPGDVRRRSSRTTRAFLGLALAATVVLALAACTPAPPPGAAASPTPPPIPEASFTGGTAGARLTLPQKVAWDGGYCERGTDDAWLAMNIGSPNGAEYFGLVVGQSPYTPGATRTASGGGTFGGDDAAVTWRHAGTATRLAHDGLTVVVAADLARGTFSGHLADGTEVSGGFSC
jgi:hypothetical protein